MVHEYGQYMMTCLDLFRTWLGPAPFKRVAGPIPVIKGGVGVGFTFGDGYGLGEETMGKEVGRYFCS